MEFTKEMGIATGLILDERARQIAKHGEERDITWDRRAVILVEEVGEVCKAIQDEGTDAILREAVHVAAVGMAMVEAALAYG
jgi:NTP pyrophosphatase (non-canonical NTP hydrolase)